MSNPQRFLYVCAILGCFAVATLATLFVARQEPARSLRPFAVRQDLSLSSPSCPDGIWGVLMRSPNGEEVVVLPTHERFSAQATFRIVHKHTAPVTELIGPGHEADGPLLCYCSQRTHSIRKIWRLSDWDVLYDCPEN